MIGVRQGFSRESIYCSEIKKFRTLDHRNFAHRRGRALNFTPQVAEFNSVKSQKEPFLKNKR